MNATQDIDGKFRDYVVIIDQSASMAMNDVDDFDSRWDAVAETTQALVAKVLEFDDDGIEVYLFSSIYKKNYQKFTNVNSAKFVKDVFSTNKPNGSTPMADVLKAAIDSFFKRKEDEIRAYKKDNLQKYKVKAETIFVITDGIPDSKKAVESEIVRAAKKIAEKVKNMEFSENSLTLSLLQIGKDTKAKKFLMNLDVNLKEKYKIPDIVDTKTFDEIETVGNLQKVVISAINGGNVS